MFNRFMLRTWAMLALGLLAACGSQAIPAGLAPTGAAQPTRAPAAPTAAAPIVSTAAAPTAPAAAPTADSAALPEGLTLEGYHMLGRPDAPVTLVMYSDFL